VRPDRTILPGPSGPVNPQPKEQRKANMPAPKLTDFLTDPAHKEERDFMQGVIDARLKELEEKYRKERKESGGKNKKDKDESGGTFWDNLFSGGPKDDD
jgi:hypothetical protein